MTDAERRRMVMVHNERVRALVNFCVGTAVAMLIAATIGDGRFGTGAEIAAEPVAGPLGIGILASMFFFLCAMVAVDGLRVET